MQVSVIDDLSRKSQQLAGLTTLVSASAQRLSDFDTETQDGILWLINELSLDISKLAEKIQ